MPPPCRLTDTLFVATSYVAGLSLATLSRSRSENFRTVLFSRARSNNGRVDRRPSAHVHPVGGFACRTRVILGLKRIQQVGRQEAPLQFARSADPLAPEASLLTGIITRWRRSVRRTYSSSTMQS